MLNLTNGETISTYHLKALIYHRGANQDSGHYYSYVNVGGAFYSFDDAVVNRVGDLKEILVR